MHDQALPDSKHSLEHRFAVFVLLPSCCGVSAHKPQEAVAGIEGEADPGAAAAAGQAGEAQQPGGCQDPA